MGASFGLALTEQDNQSKSITRVISSFHHWKSSRWRPCNEKYPGPGTRPSLVTANPVIIAGKMQVFP